MTVEKTLSIIKPDATSDKLAGLIIDMIEKDGLEIVKMKKMQFDIELAQKFYDVHKERPFFNDLVNFMVSGPVIVMELQGENAIKQYRTLMGATNPSDADPKSIRGKYAQSIDKNCVHGSDAGDTAAYELGLIFG